MNNSNDHDDYEAQRERMREQLADNPDALAWALDSIDRDERMTRDAPPLRPCPDWCRHPYPENHGWEYTAADEYVRGHVVELAAGMWVAAREQFLDGAYLLDPPLIGLVVDDDEIEPAEARELARALLAAADAADGIAHGRPGGDDDLIESYVAAHPELASETLKVRARTLRSFDRLHGLAAAMPAEIESFLATPGWSPQTRKSYGSHLRAFYAWLQKAGVRDDNPAEDIRRYRVPRRLPRPLSPEALRTLVAEASGSLRTAVLLGALAGLRCVEIAAVHSDHITGDRLFIPHGKGGGQATVPLHPALRADLAQYDGYVFPRPDGGHVTSQAVQHRIRRHMARCGIAGNPHQLRHTFGTNVYRHTHDLRLTQELLRHSSPDTTAIYTLVDDESRTAAVAGLTW